MIKTKPGGGQARDRQGRKLQILIAIFQDKRQIYYKFKSYRTNLLEILLIFYKNFTKQVKKISPPVETAGLIDNGSD
jgi:hypothetical protein